ALRMVLSFDVYSVGHTDRINAIHRRATPERLAGWNEPGMDPGRSCNANDPDHGRPLRLAAAQVRSDIGLNSTTRPTTASTGTPVVSTSTASGAGFSGATVRWASRASRAWISCSKEAIVTSSPLSFNCLWRLTARSSALAVRNTL